jgi:outer membrane murein-binding lipoprotein Lpp
MLATTILILILVGVAALITFQFWILKETLMSKVEEILAIVAEMAADIDSLQRDIEALQKRGTGATDEELTIVIDRLKAQRDRLVVIDAPIVTEEEVPSASAPPLETPAPDPEQTEPSDK